jgi:MFS family permease
MDQNRKIIYSAGFIFYLAIGFAAYINSNFLSSLVGEKLTGVIFSLASLAGVLSLLLAPKIFKKLGGYKFLVLVALLDAFSLLAIALLQNAWAIALVFILGFALNILIVFSLDELLKIFSKNSNIGETRGIYLSLDNFAWILCQLSIAILLGSFPLRAMYLTGFFIMLLFTAICFFSLKNIPEPTYDRINSLKFIGNFFTQKNLRRAYGFSFLVYFFYAWMLIYTPIYLYGHLGFSLKELGFIFMIMLLPFLFIPVSLGRYADKIGERKMLIWGFFFTALSTLALFFAGVHNVALWAILLFATRLGIATAESMSDTYFFKHIKPENEEFVGVYRSAPPVAEIIGPLVAFLMLLLVPSFNFIFLILGAIMLSGVYLASTIRKSDI